jgi:hypothetical protein
MTYELMPHQREAIGKMRNGSVLKGGVGTGKTITALGYFYGHVAGGCLEQKQDRSYHPPTSPRDLYVITTAKKRDSLDWEEEALMGFGISRDPDLSAGGIKLTVDSWNNIDRYVGVKDAFFIFDEQRLVGSGAWVKAFHKLAQDNQWILLSATPGDSWIEYAPIFIAHGWYKNRTEFMKKHVVYNTFAKFPKIDRYVETGILEKYRRAVLVEMPYNRHTKRHVLNTMVGYDEALYNRVVKDRWHVYEERPIRDIAEMIRVARQVINSDTSRLAAVMELLEKHDRLIIFYNFNYELDMLRTLSCLGLPMAEWNGIKHQPIPEAKKWIYLVQYTAGAEGWNCISTNAICFWSLNYSYKITEQGRGRIDRLNTPFDDLYYYTLRSMAGVDTAINKKLATKTNFSEKAYVKQAGLWPEEKEPEKVLVSYQ